MEQQWLNTLDKKTAVIVPTRSLANSLSEQIASQNLAAGKTVWEVPNILLWQDYLSQLWQLNREAISAETGAHTLISPTQSLLLWTQVIESTRRSEKELLLLNVQQTARAVQRSRKLMADWLITSEQIKVDHIIDTEQFLIWVNAYQDLLKQRSLIDTPLLLQTLNDSPIRRPYSKLIWFCFDLVTDVQRLANQHAEQAGVTIEFEQMASRSVNAPVLQVYTDYKHELKSVFGEVKQRVERDPDCRINVVIPDLQLRQTQVKELARQVFYPSLSPLEIQRLDTVYRFSLGQPLKDWAAIETALAVLAMLKNHTSTVALSFLFRNEFLASTKTLASECRLFERWLQRQRYSHLTFDKLPELYMHCLESLTKRDLAPDNPQLGEKLTELVTQRQELQNLLNERKKNNGFAALSFSEWVSVFTQWLAAWEWRIDNRSDSLHSVQYQLHKRWQSLLEEFAALVTVQKQAGLSRALDVLSQMSRDTVFLPKAVASPVFISGLYEVIGRPADLCYLTGMDQSFPPAPRPDAFLPQRLFANTAFPDRSAENSFQQARQVNHSIVSTGSEVLVSYARVNSLGDEHSQSSPLYRNRDFEAVMVAESDFRQLPLETYLDTQGPAWSDPTLVRGGARIFENQSQCEFKAFATHQLGFLEHEESEFGLDALERGNVIHRMLDRLWAQIGSQQKLKALTQAERVRLVEQCIDGIYAEQERELSPEKSALLYLERHRHTELLTSWLLVEEKRVQNFTVVEREERREASIGGIPFTYIIDRLDMTDDGRTVIIDYKTSDVARRDWLGERIKSPQMPLYSLAIDQIKRKPVAGIAFAQVGTDGSYQELSEAGIFRDGHYATKFEQSWQQSRDQWQQLFEQLARDFLAGNAEVNPIDEDTCRYCELRAVCRVEQLRQATQSSETPAEGTRHD